MIPLRHSESVSRFPRLSLAVCALWLVCFVVSRFVPWTGLSSLLLVHPNVVALLNTLLFTWAFTPKLFERGALIALILGVTGAFFSLGIYRQLNPHNEIPVLVPHAVLGAWLGACLRLEAWGTLQTFVVGPGWLRVLDVPAYVLLFFWLFYLFLAQLLMPPALSDAPMPYVIPMLALLWGFAWQSARILLQRKK